MRLQNARSALLRVVTLVCVSTYCLPAAATSLDDALALYRTGDCLAAIKALKELAPANPAANLPLGRCYVESASYREAIDPLLASLRDFPSDTRALRLLVTAYTSLKLNDEAANLVHSYFVQHPDSLAAKVESGRLQLAAGDKENAASTFQSVLDKSPDFPPALLGLGLVATANQQWSQATQYLTRASRIAPGVAAIYSALGDLYVRQGNVDQAVVPYKQAFDLMPSNFAAAKSLAKCYAQLGKQDEVARVLQSATLQEARDTEATAMAAVALKADPKALTEYLRNVIELNPENVVARKLRAETLETSHNRDEAEAEYIEILKLEKDNPDPLTCYRLAVIKEAKNSLDDARHYYELAARSPNATVEMHLALAHIDLALKNAPEAQLELNKIGDPANRTPEFRLMQLEVYVRGGQFDSAAPLAGECLAKSPNDPKVLDLAALVAHKQQKFDDEAALLERLFQTSQDDKDLRYRLVHVYVFHPELKKDDRTLELLSNFTSGQGTDSEGYFYLADLYRRNKDLDSARKFFDLGFSHLPTPTPPALAWAYRDNATVLGNQNKWDEALLSEQKALELDPTDENALSNLGVIYIKLSRLDEAAGVVAKLRSVDPESADRLEAALPKSSRKVKTAAP